MVDALTDIRRIWFPPSGEESTSLAHKHRAADHLRAAIAQLVAIDVDSATIEELARIEALAAELSEAISAAPDLRRHGPLPTLPAPDGALVERSPVSGRGNAVAPPITYAFEGDVTRASVVFSPAYEGPPGGVHGGYVAAAFDEVLGVAQMAAGAAGFTGTLTVRYHALTPIGERIEYEAKPTGRDGRKLLVSARATAQGSLVAEAEGVFITHVNVPGA